MNTSNSRHSYARWLWIVAGVAAVGLIAMRGSDTGGAGAGGGAGLAGLAGLPGPAGPVGPVAPAGTPALRLALAAHAGQHSLDEQIRAQQAQVRERAELPRLERLAALFISKARTSGDPGFYKQAEACSQVMTAVTGGGDAAALVLGHVRHALHDFVAAEGIARRLVAARGMFLDQGLLGDVLLDLGRLDEAREVYQKMLDQRPGLQSYARAAEVRWLLGDLAGCRELLAAAAAAGSSRDPESLAWVLARRAALELNANDAATGLSYADQALQQVADYPAALVVRGRAALALGKHPEAEQSLAAAVGQYPLPEYLWGHAEALREQGNTAKVEAVEAELRRTGEREDPRTFALWLATRGDDPATALRLAMAEYALRQDARTLDVLALCRFRVGDFAGAMEAMQRALGTGIVDPRIFLHAGLIHLAAGQRTEAAAMVGRAREHQAALWPNERTELSRLAVQL